MTPPDDSTAGGDAGPVTHRAVRRPPGWLLGLGAGGVFAAGLIGGGVAVTVSGVSAQTRVEVVPSPSPSPVPPTAQSGPATGQFALDAACVRAMNEVQSVYDELHRLGSAASSLDAGALDRSVRHLQAMGTTLRRDIRNCHATLHLPAGHPSSSPASPSTG